MGRTSRAITSLTFILFLFLPWSEAKASDWKSFGNRTGWSIQYPADWKLASCRNCQDFTAPGVFVHFLPAGGSVAEGSVMVEQLKAKPENVSVDAWFRELKTSANQNPEKGEETFTVSGFPALRVRYRNVAVGIEMEETFVVSGRQTYSIGFSSEKSGVPLEQLHNYSIYMRMVRSFRIQP
jgi:hypothetical protein